MTLARQARPRLRKTGKRLENTQWLIARLRTERVTSAVRCGVATGPWRTLALSPAQGSAVSLQSTPGNGGVISSAARQDPQKGVCLTVTDDRMADHCRIIALTESGPGTYQGRLTLRFRNVRTQEIFFAHSNWHTFRATPAGLLPGQARTPVEELQKAEALISETDYGRYSLVDAYNGLLAPARKYGGTKYALEAHFQAGIMAQTIADLPGPSFDKGAVEAPKAVTTRPVGRYALPFDGVDDCLVVPARASLQLKPPFSIEVWAKGDFSMFPRAGRRCRGPARMTIPSTVLPLRA